MFILKIWNTSMQYIGKWKKSTLYNYYNVLCKYNCFSLDQGFRRKFFTLIWTNINYIIIIYLYVTCIVCTRFYMRFYIERPWFLFIIGTTVNYCAPDCVILFDYNIRIYTYQRIVTWPLRVIAVFDLQNRSIV